MVCLFSPFILIVLVYSKGSTESALHGRLLYEGFLDRTQLAVWALQAIHCLDAFAVSPYGQVDGLHHMVYEIVDNAVDEPLAGRCTLIQVHLNPDGAITVRGNVRSIPAEKSTTATIRHQDAFTEFHLDKDTTPFPRWLLLNRYSRRAG